MEFIIVLVILMALDLVAWRWGANSTERFDSPHQLVVLVLDKRWDPQIEGPRTRGPRGQKNHAHAYYKGTPSRLMGVLIDGGEEITERCILRGV